MDHIGDLVKILQKAMGTESEIHDNISGRMTKYKLYGGGLGFAWLEFNKQSQKAKYIYDQSRELKDIIDKEVIQRGFTKEQQTELPLLPMVTQDLSYNEKYMSLVAKYMELCGVRAHVMSRLD